MEQPSLQLSAQDGPSSSAVVVEVASVASYLEATWMYELSRLFEEDGANGSALVALLEFLTRP